MIDTTFYQRIYLTHIYIYFFNILFQGCTWLRERNIKHINYDHYVFLLNCVRSEERKRGSSSAISFIMQKHDMYHLVNNIWHGHSAVSENADLFLLRIVRYNMNEEWSPWNCILLTEEEAAVHSRIENLADVYSKPLIERVLLAHQLAKNQFKYVRTHSFVEDRREIIYIDSTRCRHLRQFEKDFREKFHKISREVIYKPAIKVDDYLYS